MTKKTSLAPKTIPSRSVPLRCMSDGTGKLTEYPGLLDPLLEISKQCLLFLNSGLGPVVFLFG